MPRPVYRKRATLALLASPHVPQVGEEAGDTLPAPNAPGLWLYTLTNSRCEVVRKAFTGELVFPAGQYGEEETPVALVEERHRTSAALSRYGFVRIHKVFDV